MQVVMKGIPVCEGDVQRQKSHFELADFLESEENNNLNIKIVNQCFFFRISEYCCEIRGGGVTE